MKKLLTLLFVFCAFPLFADDTFTAMQDELDRNKNHLKTEGMAAPYFISYNFLKSSYANTSASLGSKINTEVYSDAFGWLNMRVGSKKMDNTGFGGGWTWRGYAPDGYDGIRQLFWDASGNAYGDYLAQLAQKEAYLQKRNVSEYYDDFSSSPRAVVEEPQNPDDVDLPYLETVAKELSAAGKKYKNLEKFIVDIAFQKNKKYYLDTEGNKYFSNPLSLAIVIETLVRAKDGTELKITDIYNYFSLSDAPSKEDLVKKANAFALKTDALSKAVKAEMYIGPVLLERGAAVTFLKNLFAKNIINSKPYLYEDGEDRSAGEFRNKLGLPVIAQFFDVYDDPTAREFNGVTLAGHYLVDDEGVAAEKIDLVKRGKLVGLPTMRSLIKGQKSSNGHGRGTYFAAPRAGLGNIFFVPDAEHTVAADQLKNKLIEKCKEAELEYCYRFDAWGNIAYKVYLDGREEPVYGALPVNMPTRSLRDIIYAGDDFEAYLLGEPRSSIITPSLILSEMEIAPTQSEPGKRPPVGKP